MKVLQCKQVTVSPCVILERDRQINKDPDAINEKQINKTLNQVNQKIQQGSKSQFWFKGFIIA